MSKIKSVSLDKLTRTQGYNHRRDSNDTIKNGRTYGSSRDY